MAPIQEDGPYQGPERLVVALDIGTCLTAVSLVHLQPFAIPKVRTVSKWPGSPEDLKIPSLILYDGEGRPRCFGAEALEDCQAEMVRSGAWSSCQWFKLHLHPPTTTCSPDILSVSSSDNDETATLADTFEPPPLPAGVTIEQVYADLIGYLWRSTGDWFQEKTANGDLIWNRLAKDASIVFAHPDGWAEPQQELIRRAVLRSGIFASATELSSDRLQFLRESEASVHWSLHNHDTASWLQVGTTFTIVDAGGSTVDTALFVVNETSPRLSLTNAKASESVLAGGVYVTRSVTSYFESKLRGSRYGSEYYLADIKDEFEKNTKRKFVGTEMVVNVKFANLTDNDIDTGVRMGRITVNGRDIADCFDPYIKEIIATVDRQTKGPGSAAEHIIVVGGFGESPYLIRSLRSHFEPQGIKVVTGDEPTKKAVAEGCIHWYCRSLVVARAARSSFGIAIVYAYNRDDEDHLSRGQIVLPDRTKAVRGGWSTVIQKDTIVGTQEMTTTPYTRLVTNISQLKEFEIELFAYNGTITPKWLLDAYGNVLPGFSQVCTIRADLSNLYSTGVPQVGAGGVTYYEINFRLGITFGTNSLSAFILWREDGNDRQGPASVVISALKGRQ